jgi:hypothetical protein
LTLIFDGKNQNEDQLLASAWRRCERQALTQLGTLEWRTLCHFNQTCKLLTLYLHAPHPAPCSTYIYICAHAACRVCVHHNVRQIRYLSGKQAARRLCSSLSQARGRILSQFAFSPSLSAVRARVCVWRKSARRGCGVQEVACHSI